MSPGMLLGLPGFLFELRPYGFQAGSWFMAGRVYSAGKSGPTILASLAPILFITGLGVSQVVLGLIGRSELGMKIVAAIMLATVLGSLGLFLVASIWGELRAWVGRTRELG
jgi:hypothetical protein